MSPAAASKKTPTEIRDAIENDILRGVVKPGERLDEVTLANRFGVSRTPVREALMQLESSGLIELRPHRGAVVAKMGIERLVQMFEVMAELEAAAGRFAARRHTKADGENILAAHEKCRTAASNGDSDAYYYENEEFHCAIYRASHNGVLTEQCLALQRRLRPYRRLQLRAVNQIALSFKEHETIVEALLRGDGDAASSELRQHILILGERFSDLIAMLSEH